MSATFQTWRPRLFQLCDELRERTREALTAAQASGHIGSVTRAAVEGVGDVSFGLDLPSEASIAAWHREVARQEPLSVLTEETGWRHLGPGAGEGVVELPNFDHGGPRIAFDPVDGTRNLMFDLRSAWTVVSFAGPGPGQPRFEELSGGIVSEIPPTNARVFRRLHADVGAGARIDTCELVAGVEPSASAELLADDDDRVDHGYFPFFRYEPRLRPALADFEARFFARLVEHEGADPFSLWDDQYISNAGQLALLCLGTYRMIVDARALAARRAGVESVTSKPYDVAGALLVAREAGAVLLHADGSPLDFPIDATTPVDMLGFVNSATCARLLPHWRAVLAVGAG